MHNPAKTGIHLNYWCEISGFRSLNEVLVLVGYYAAQNADVSGRIRPIFKAHCCDL